MRIIDCSGMLCPRPIIETKSAINSGKPGEIIKVIIDNDTSLGNLKKYLADNGIETIYLKEEGRHTLTFSIISLAKPYLEPEAYCEVSPSKTIKGNFIVVLNSNGMGHGSDELGVLLMKGFLSTVIELDALPQEIICYNSGVKLAKKGTPTANNLLKLSEMGVKITLCGTCVDFFGIKNDLEVGEISNMYYIASRLASGMNIIKP